MIYKIENNKLIQQNESGFKLERDLQLLIENNLSLLFGLEFIQTEFSIGDYRFDTVAFDNESNSFIIIEYKKGMNESIIDQGYAYLSTLLDRRADLVLLYNEVNNSNRLLKDFDWSQTRLIFVSPKFNDYQINAASLNNTPFDLYEVKKYDDLVQVNLVNKKSIKFKKGNNISILPDTAQKVSREIKVYTEDDHLKVATPETANLYEQLKEELLNIGDLKIDPKKVYIAFKRNTNVCDIEIRKNWVVVFINMREGTLKDPMNKAESIADIGHVGNGDYRMRINNTDDIDYALLLIKQSYKNN